jgi:flavin-dependent dehydrogenase
LPGSKQLWRGLEAVLHKDATVVVVGAGPVGLAAALALRSQGIAVRVVEAQPADRTRPGSRAIFVHRACARPPAPRPPRPR